MSAEKQNKELQAYEDQAKSFNDSFSKIQQTNNDLQKSLSRLTAQNTQAAKDLADAKVYTAQPEQQLKQRNKGCFGMIVMIINFLGLACSLVYACLLI